MMSYWYQELWGDRFQLTSDQATKTRYENNRTGFRIADYVGGGTGERSDRAIIDDPHEIIGGESQLKRARALLWFNETLPTRMNDPKLSAVVMIMQRIHALDLAGEALAKNLGYVHVMLPMEFEVERRCRTSIGFVDPRTKEGELLFPERFPREVVERDKKAMGQYAIASQFQQRPAPRGGGMFKTAWFSLVDAAPADCYWVRHWDLAATEKKDAAFTAGVLIGQSRSTKMFYIADVKRDRLDGNKVKQLIKVTSDIDLSRFGKRNYEVSLPQDPGQAGLTQAQDLILLLAGHNVHAERETGDKETRARPFAAQVEAGNVKLVTGRWNEAYLAELAEFPVGKFMDQVDASSGAFGRLILRAPQGQITVQPVRGHA
jgi:predicted phage terminase large subunit-like protein